MWLTKVSIKNPYFATVLMLALMLLGLIAGKNIGVEEFPNIKFPVVVVTTNYPGASPEVVETDVSKPIEEALNSLNGIKDIRSYSFEGQSVVVAEFELNFDPELVLQDSRDKISIVAAGFRKDIDTPTISKVNMQDQPIISLAISSNTMSLRNITDWINQVAKKRLQTIDGVGDVKLVGGVERQVRINIEPYKLQSMGLSVNDVISAIQKSNDNYPMGDIKSETSDISIRLNGRIKDPLDFAKVVITSRNGVPIRVSDVANVTDGEEELNSLTLVDGKQAVGLDIRQIDGANVVEVADKVYDMINKLNQIKPSGIDISVIYDVTISTKASLNNVEQTLLEGALLTIIIVFIFLKSWRSTVITGLTLPIALLGTIFVIYACGFTLNMMSLLALSLSIGLLIDDAIVVRENIVRHLKMGKNHYQAALDGTNEIGLAVLATTLTIVAVFLPVAFMQGIIGKFFFQFGITVTAAVLISLFVSFSLDPMLSSIWHEPADGGFLKKSRLGKMLDAFEEKFDSLTHFYERVIRLSLKYKKTTLLLAFSILLGSCTLVPVIGAEFAPKVDKGEYVINFKTATGSNVWYTETKVEQISKILKNAIPEIKSINAGINKGFGDGTNNASITVDIGSKNLRNKNLEQIMLETRNLLDNVGGIELLSVMPLGGIGGDTKPINIDIMGDDIQEVQMIANDLMKQIAKINNVTDLQNSYQQVNPAQTIAIDRDIASNLGVSLSDVGSTLSTLFAGNKVSTWENTKNGQNYDVVVQIPERLRSNDVLSVLRVPSNKLDSNNLPVMISLAAITTTSDGFSPREIDHINLQRKITVTGNIVGNDSQEVFAQIQKILDEYKLVKGITINQSGNKQDMEESFMYAVAALMIGVIFIYMILTAQFRSFILPLVIMVSLPLSFIGVFIALFLFGSTLNMFSIIGIIMLMGLATKNGILLVDFINQELERGLSQVEAIVNAGKTRLRPIIMTTAAMIFGMIPLVLSSGESSETRKPMAYAIIGGMTTSTILTLIIVPVIYVYLEKFSRFLRDKFVSHI